MARASYLSVTGGSSPEMIIGYNFTSYSHFDICHKLQKLELIEYVELMVDDFPGIDPYELDRIHSPVGVHIMQSRFLERDQMQLVEIAERIQDVLRCISPLYYSDLWSSFPEKVLTCPVFRNLIIIVCHLVFQFFRRKRSFGQICWMGSCYWKM